MRYTSSITLLGLPLLDVAISTPGTVGGRGIARGWVAIGDIALGGVAVGGIAVGGVGVGGLSAGVVAIAGLSAGVWSIGGLAVGAFSFGGLSVALIAATGGLAAAVEYAIGGIAIAAHANDAAARAYFESGAFFRYTDSMAPYLQWGIAVVVGLAALVWTLGFRQAPDDRQDE